MSQSLNRAGIRFNIIDRARNPHISGFGKKNRGLGNDEAGEPIVANPFADFVGEEHIPNYESIARDLGVSQIRVGDKTAIRTLRPLNADKTLLVVYSNDPTKTILTVDFGLSLKSLEDLGFDHISVVLASCRAAKELGLNPSEMGAKRLFQEAAELQSKVTEQRDTIRRAEQARQAAARNHGGIKPRLSLPTRTSAPATPAPRAMPPLPETKPEGSDWLGRVATAHGAAYRCTCGCGMSVLEATAVVPPFEVMRLRQNGRVSGKDLWAHAFAPKCISTWGNGFSLMETMASAFRAEQEAAGRRAQTLACRPPARRASPAKPACFGSSGNGAPAAQLAKKAARAEADRRRTLETKGKPCSGGPTRR